MARLTKDQLADSSRYKFKTEEVDIPELGGSVEVKTLSVAERDQLPNLLSEEVSVDDLATVFAVVVSDPKLTPDEAKKFVGDLPAPAFDAVVEKFGELIGGGEDEGKDDGSSSENN